LRPKFYCVNCVVSFCGNLSSASFFSAVRKTTKCAPPLHSPTSLDSYSRDSLLQTISTPSENTILGLFPSFLSAAGWNGSESGLEGCIVFTRDGVYELVANMDPREMFLDMVAKVTNYQHFPLHDSLFFGLRKIRAWKAKKRSHWEKRAVLMFWACMRQPRKKREIGKTKKRAFCCLAIFFAVTTRETMVELWNYSFLQKSTLLIWCSDIWRLDD
jgi:hypothetical protein